MRAFAEIFDDFGTIVLFDNIYGHMVFPSFEADAGDIRDVYSKTITGFSLSKNFAAGGYRLGWLDFAPGMDDLFTTCLCISSYMYTCPTTPVQYAGAHALSLSEDIPQHLLFQRTMFENISKVVVHKLQAMHVTCTVPQGAYYTLMDFDFYHDKFKDKYNLHTSDDLCFYLAEHYGLITVSGSAFGIKKPYVLRYSFIDVRDIDVAGESFNFFPIGKFLHTLKEWLKIN